MPAFQVEFLSENTFARKIKAKLVNPYVTAGAYVPSDGLLATAETEVVQISG